MRESLMRRLEQQTPYSPQRVWAASLLFSACFCLRGRNVFRRLRLAGALRSEASPKTADSVRRAWTPRREARRDEKHVKTTKQRSRGTAWDRAQLRPWRRLPPGRRVRRTDAGCSPRAREPMATAVLETTGVDARDGRDGHKQQGPCLSFSVCLRCCFYQLNRYI